MAKYELHDFYCLNCGKQGIGIQRKLGKQREGFHRKKLWCYHCKMECNHIEVRNQEEAEIFMEAFNNGAYKDEAAESISHVRACGIG